MVTWRGDGARGGLQVLVLHAAAALLLLAACSKTDVQHCQVGSQVACACGNGLNGTQTCTAADVYGPCQCSAQIPADGAAAVDSPTGFGGSTTPGAGTGGIRMGADAAPVTTGNGGSVGSGGTVATGGQVGGNGNGGIPGSGGIGASLGGTIAIGGIDASLGGTFASGGIDTGLGGTVASGGIPGTGGTVGAGGEGGRSTNGGAFGGGGSTVGLDAGKGGRSGNPDASLYDGGGGPGPIVKLTNGAAALIDVFVGDKGVYVVTSAGASLFDRSGMLVKSVSSPEAITSAAFDGNQLMLAAKTTLTTYDTSLAVVATGTLIEPCGASILISNHRFLCGSASDWDHVFYTFDTLSGALIATSSKYTYNGIPMKRIPGTDDFVTVDPENEPSDFNLYSVSSAGVVTYINHEPWSTINASPVFAFDGAPPVHLVSQWGVLATIFGSDCLTNIGATKTTCFVTDGNLGILTGTQQFDGMDSDAAGNLYGLIDMIDPITDPPCSHGCLLDTISVANKTVLSQRVVQLTMDRLVAFRHDPIAGAALVGYNQTVSIDGGTGTIYEVVSIPYY
jgi:hypothetical protein